MQSAHSLPRPLAAVALFAALLALGGPARANDSTARIDAGGLVFTQSSAIEMAEEDLYLSRGEVRVRYLFRNTSDKDVTTLVAFPLPKLTVGDEVNYSVDANDPDNFVDFKAAVDGEPISFETQVRATRFGVDVTDVLKAYDVPVTGITTDPDEADLLYQRLNTLPEADRQELESHGVMDWSSAWIGEGKPIASFHWQAEVVFYWQQTFPANDTIEVTHSYRPVPGVFFLDASLLEPGSEFTKQYCTDAGFRRGVSRLVERSRHNIIHGNDLRYVLTTGNNWLGPIGRFSLTIDKGTPDALISLCIDGIEKTGPTTFVHRAENFAPEKDIDVLFAVPVE
ncbi:DUF4424 domain-containing protein [Rhodobium gokarnense]|uniref:DUF4424 domain-containing protein n=1 Tax=Rhodobium gokarnense TaxID=364296 RepID=A0ABT3HIJ5_9HYPH|nr:DUF4424 domain-containing protein [Rhodobium gokarnense]MCW2310225.1 hypothetical protein [Rhodobium gokarnense]